MNRLRLADIRTGIFLQATAFGIGALSVLIFVLGATSNLTPGPVLLGAGMLLLAAGGMSHVRGGYGWMIALPASAISALRSTHYDWKFWLVLLLFCLQVAVNLASALAPPVEGDTLNTYLVAPKWWVIDGAVGHVENSNNSIFGPSSFVSALVLMFGSDLSSLLVNGFGAGLLSAVAVYLLTRQLGGEGLAALMAATIYLTLPDVWYQASSAKADMLSSLFNLCMILALFDDTDSLITRHTKAGVLSGLAIWTKLSALLAVPALCVASAIYFRRESRGLIIQCLALFALTSALMTTPSFLLNWESYGNPVYPLSIGPFEGVVDVANIDQSVPTEKGLGGLISVIGFQTFGQRFHGFGPFLLVFLPLSIWGLSAFSRETRALVFFCLVYFLTWYGMRQVARDLLPVLAMSGVGASLCVTSTRLYPFPVGRLVSLLVGLGCVLSLSAQSTRNMLYHERWRYAFSSMSRGEYLNTVLQKVDPVIPRWDMITWVNDNVSPQTKALNLFSHVNYYFDQRLIGPQNPVVDSMLGAGSHEALMGLLRDACVTHVFFKRNDFALQHAESIILSAEFARHNLRERFSNGYAVICEVVYDRESP